ncbi:patatin-like phospholipase family protein [Roseospira marina]|uniref:Patatin-like phospholipase family protein n=1 Tax=Roseospira marina TaxID=140057 RepID=A0A5M6IFG9_9PROT|nr:patatin-like phospholipase family protein [Roseospira marina]KAA5607021.1 patatin-like phospholipase family protein [Roseospira marina]MBB4312794.1 NTE family protein [Roseospira marina]MBB5086433.1 NTE family protein [Roseospira marina]
MAATDTSATNARPINVALQGGGAHGAFTWGVLDRILEDGRLVIDGLSGTSAGSMNAVVYAYGKMTGGPEGARAALHDFWSEVSRAGQLYAPVRMLPWEQWDGSWNMDRSPLYMMFDALTRAVSPYVLNPFDFNPLRDVLERTVDFDALVRCECTRLFISATNVRSGRVRVFTAPEMSADVVMASACLPFLFKAVDIDGEAYWDGGYMGNPSLFPFYYYTGTDDVLIVNINPVERAEVPRSASDIMNRVNEISFNSPLLGEMRAIAFVQKLIEEDWLDEEHKGKLRRVRFHAIRADHVMCDLSVASKFNTDWEFLCDLRDRGRAAADAWMQAHLDAVGVGSTVNLHHDYLGAHGAVGPAPGAVGPGTET